MTPAERFITRCTYDAMDADRDKWQVDSVMRTAARIAITHMPALPRTIRAANDL